MKILSMVALLLLAGGCSTLEKPHKYSFHGTFREGSRVCWYTGDFSMNCGPLDSASEIEEVENKLTQKIRSEQGTDSGTFKLDSWSLTQDE